MHKPTVSGREKSGNRDILNTGNWLLKRQKGCRSKERKEILQREVSIMQMRKLPSPLLDPLACTVSVSQEGPHSLWWGHKEALLWLFASSPLWISCQCFLLQNMIRTPVKSLRNVGFYLPKHRKVGLDLKANRCPTHQITYFFFLWKLLGSHIWHSKML